MYRKRIEFQGYAVSNLTKEVKAAIKKDKITEKQLIDWMLACAIDGYKVSLSFDHENETYQASLYCQDPNSPNAGLMLSQRHIDAITALKALRTIHSEVYAGVWLTKETFDW